MWVIRTWVTRRTSMPEAASFRTGLPPTSTTSTSERPTKAREVVSRVALGIAPEVPRKTKCTALGWTGAFEEKWHEHEGQDDPDPARQLGDPDRAEHEAVGPEPLDDEPPDGVEPDVDPEEARGRAFHPVSERPDEQGEHQEVPERLVEERRVEELLLGVEERAVGRRDVELPRERGRRAERFLVEEVPPAADRLPQRQARGD